MIEQRKVAEIAAWDHLHAEGVKTPRSMIYRSAELVLRYTEEWIRTHVRGNVFLDLCCGNGRNTVIAAKAGALSAIGMDISEVSIRAAQNLSRGLPNVKFIKEDCERTSLPDQSIDAVLCTGSIQHLDFERTMIELRRILVAGGRCLIVSVLPYNPAIALYRRLTPGMRTEWSIGNAVSLSKLRLARRYLDVQNVRYWHLASLASIPLANTKLFAPALKVANAADSLLTRAWPIKYLAWMISFELIASPCNARR